MTTTVTRIINERSRTHGSFEENGIMAQTARVWLRSGSNWNMLHPAQQLALDEIVLKMARILSLGVGHTVEEHWNDIAGYATKGGELCSKHSASRDEPIS